MQLLLGDCLEVLKTLPDNSVDSLVTDPPSAIGFMGMSWDSDKGGRKQWIAWMTEVMKECLRVLKPGAHGLVWALPRTSHWTATALEDAGFQIRDSIEHCFGSGFPKSLDISKAIDKAAGAERKVITASKPRKRPNSLLDKSSTIWDTIPGETSPSTDAAKQWQGWGTALKPAHETWWLVRKPCSEDTVAANVLLHGTGGINIDASRIGLNGEKIVFNHTDKTSRSSGIKGNKSDARAGQIFENTQGRFPANLIYSHSPGCVEVGTKKVKGSNDIGKGNKNIGGSNNINIGGGFTQTSYTVNGTETVAAWECTDDCAVAELDRQSGTLKSGGKQNASYSNDNDGVFTPGGNQISSFYGSSGGASRFFYCAKPSKREKNLGCEDSFQYIINDDISEDIIKEIESYVS